MIKNNLNSVIWKEFKIKDVFKVVNSKPYHKLNLNIENGEIPYITRTSFNNGLECFVQDRDFILNPNNTISIGAENVTFFYQEKKYITGNKMYYLINKNINRYTGLFITQSLQNSVKNCGFGYSKGLTGTRLKNRIVFLPINSKGQPNWEFMENYMRKIEEKQKQKAIKYYSDKIKNLQNSLIKNKFDLNNIEWKEFKISNFFEVSGTITTHPTKLKPNGKTPRITCASTNNGLDTTYDNESTEKGKILTVDSATIGYVAYQENDFIATDHVEKIMFKNGKSMNRYLGLFIKQCIDNSVLSKYGYGYKFSQNRIKKQIIKLPVNSKGQPNWEFMENFMRKIEYKKLNIYLDYIKNKTATN
ncbi:restriction endonuclease subunit S [Brachyspira aalborgi]|uniref:Restriction endonuclease n=1 Tax=Brachyspira aalborgi TaxID=29522 RepID=A0A5C8CHA7_9SPIR|nr:restriction endonuclease subunit S [Brachyspira aalborgi]TXJ12235.1 restriction endonuclease [Brachyspira aalborgi]